MPSLFSSKHIIKILEREGSFFISQKGSNTKYKKISGENTFIVIIPSPRKEIPYGTFRSILKQSELNESLFLK